MLLACLMAGAALCAFMAVQAKRLLTSALWLAGVSAFTAVALYQLGAQQVAVIELSVGAGLVTVLFVFAISIAGDDALGETSPVPARLAAALLLVFAALLAWMVLPLDGLDGVSWPSDFTAVLWGDRALDVLLQIVVIFTGVLGILGLLSEVSVAAVRQRAATELPQRLSSANGHGTPSPDPGEEPEMAEVA